MLVVYRITDIPSTNPSPIFPNDKYRLNKFCLKSFLKAFEGVDIDMTFLCDYCSFETIAMIRDLVPDSEIIETNIGINETMLKAYDIAIEASQGVDNEIILFQECDYYWLPDTGATFINATKILGLVSPYDHANFYIDTSIHSEDIKIKLIDGYHFRTTERNTMTFAITSFIFRNYSDIFKKWGYLDNGVWLEMADPDRNYKLWTPIPTFATHMVTDYLSPSIDWQSLWKTQI